MPGPTEADFEAHIVRALVEGGWIELTPADVPVDRPVIEADLAAFVRESQPAEWDKLESVHGAEAASVLAQEVWRKVQRDGAIKVLRGAVRYRDASVTMAFGTPSNALNPELARQHGCNRFAVVRQVRCNPVGGDTVDLVLFLNGVAVATVELKNSLTGQDAHHACQQYKQRNKDWPLFSWRHVAVHFAVDDRKAFMATRLSGVKTRFLPFNQALVNRAPDDGDYASCFLWREVWERENLLEWVLHFVHDQTNAEVEYDARTGDVAEKKSTFTVFPRYHQWRAVRRIVEALRAESAPREFLIQHSAGSGKSNSIVWLAYQLSMFFRSREDERRYFDTVFIVTDRRMLDKPLQNNLLQFSNFQQGMIAAIDERMTSQDLKAAIEEGRHVVVTTLQKFPVISKHVAAQTGKKFAVIVDEAHSSQTGEAARDLRMALSAEEIGEIGNSIDFEAAFEAEVRARGRQENIHYFAFTATPKPRTLELFGTTNEVGDKVPFDTYTMEQAIKEGFILDVLQGYMSFRRYFELMARPDADGHEYDEDKAVRLLTRWVDLQEEAIEQKARIILEHFRDGIASGMDNRARGMVVTKSRLAAVRFKRVCDRLMAEMGMPYRSLVAFSGTVTDPDNKQEYTESGMNQIQEILGAKRSIPQALKFPKFRLLIVANKFQTGFDEPLLQAMYVDKKLGGVSTVQTLSRLNRNHNDKSVPVVLDFVNDPEQIREDFQRYYGSNRILSGDLTDDRLLHDLMDELDEFSLYSQAELDAFVSMCRQGLDPGSINGRLDVFVGRFAELDDEEQVLFRGRARDFVRLYRFLAQIMDWQSVFLEKNHILLTQLLQKLPLTGDELPYEVVGDVDLQRYVISKTSESNLALEPDEGVLFGQQVSTPRAQEEDEELTAIEEIVKGLNAVTALTSDNEDVRKIVAELDRRVGADAELQSVIGANNSREEVRDHMNGFIERQLINITREKVDVLVELMTPTVLQELQRALHSKHALGVDRRGR